MIETGWIIEPKGATPSVIEQVHGNHVVRSDSSVPKADAIWTDRFLTTIHIVTADCLPVLIHGKDADPIAAVHAGWRGALAGIVAETRTALKIRPCDLRILLGPCLGPCCFEVKADFIELFNGRGYDIARFLQTATGTNQAHFDLRRWILATQLSDLEPHQISIDNRCTYCSPERLPSFRRNKSTDPRIRTWIRKTQPDVS